MSFNVTNPYQTFYDSTGAVRAGGFVTFYENRTSTKTTIYSDDDLTIAQNNPYELDAAGRITGDVKFQGLVTMQITNADGSDVRTDDDVTTSFPTAIVGDSIQEIDDLTALRALTPADSSAVIYLRYHTIDGNGGGHFRGVIGAAPGTYTDDDGRTIVPTGGDGSAAWLHNDSEPVNVKWFGAVGDGSTDDTAAIQATIDYFATGGGKIYFPAGTYLVTSTITVDQPQIHLKGDGQGATRILFVPAAADTCLLVEAPAGGTIARFSVRGMTFYSTDTTYKKTAINLIDATESELIDVGTISPHWRGAGSIFAKFNGRDICRCRDWIAWADTAIHFGQIPAPHTPGGIGVDHHNFHNMYLGAMPGYPIIEVEDGTLLTQISFTGHQSWIGGDDGFYWVDTTSTGVSNGLSFENVRWESGVDVAKYSIYIDHNTTLQGLTIKGGQAGTDRKGFYLRNVENITFDTLYYTGATEALNVDSTVKRIEGRNCFWQASSTAILTGQKLSFASPKNPSTGALAPDFIYRLESDTSRDLTLGGNLQEYVVEVANDGVHDLPTGMGTGMLFITTGEGTCAQFALKGTVNGTAEISDWAGHFSVTATTASSTNVYYSSGYKVENKRGGTSTYTILFIGT